MRVIKFERKALEHLSWFEKHDTKVLSKIHTLLEDIKLHPYSGIGKPEALRGNLFGYWSRRITKEHRLVYKIEGNTIIIIASCKLHY